MHVRGGLWNLITHRWILISVWWDTKHPSQSTDVLATNHFNAFILFWPLSGLFFVFHITFPSHHYSLSVLGLFCIHPLPFNSLSYPVLHLSLISYPSFSQTHLSFSFFSLFHPSLKCPHPLSSLVPLPSPSMFSVTSTVKTNPFPAKLELECLYSAWLQVQSVKWKYQNKSRHLHQSSKGLGSISTTLPRPITSETAGNYTCTLQLKNGQTVWVTQAVIEGGRGSTASQWLASFLIFLAHST